MENIKEIVAQNILNLRKINKLTQYELAEKINYSDKAVSRWEKGESLPDLETLNNIAKVFNVSISYLLEPHSYDDIPINNQKIAKLLIVILSVAVVWMTSIVLFFYLGANLSHYYWQIFIWALPVSTLVLMYYNYKLGNKKYLLILDSILIWSFITAIYLHFIHLNLWLLFLIGLPIQTIIVINYLKKPFKKLGRKK